MGILLDIGLLVFGFVFGTLWFATIVLPLIYGLPKSLWWVKQGKLKWWTPLKYFVSPVLWSVFLVIVSFSLLTWAPGAAKTLTDSAAFNLASLAGAGISLLSSVFSASTRRDMQADFESFVAPNRI